MKPFIKQQKIIRVDDNYAVVLDKDFIDATKLNVNEPLVGYYHEHGVSFITPTHPYAQPQRFPEEQQEYSQTTITPEFKEWVERTLKENEEAMRVLANL